MARPLVYGGLAVGVLVVSTAAILIRAAQNDGADSVVIATLRLGLATLALAPLALAQDRARWGELTRKDVLWCAMSGVCLAVHFGTWITSLEFTSVASSTALVTTNPVWVGIASLVLLRESVSRETVWGIMLAIAGTLTMLVADSANVTTGSSHLLGNALALVGAVSASGYLIIGRSLRVRVPLLTYVCLGYGSGAIILWITVALQGHTVTGMSSLAYWCIIALALGPQLLGHTLLNWSVRQLPATLVALSILGEPIGSSLLALLIFGETISRWQALGFALILAGIFFATVRTEPR
ncbi:MAG: DMT family transporter [Betaproteobacteria bacterium]|nr:DMT family transporter [Betaproteobacteria bacterium]